MGSRAIPLLIAAAFLSACSGEEALVPCDEVQWSSRFAFVTGDPSFEPPDVAPGETPLLRIPVNPDTVEVTARIGRIEGEIGPPLFWRRESVSQTVAEIPVETIDLDTGEYVLSDFSWGRGSYRIDPGREPETPSERSYVLNALLGAETGVQCQSDVSVAHLTIR